MGLSSHVYKELESISGREHVTRSKEDLLCYAYDSTGKCVLPAAIIFPGSETEVSGVLKLANQRKLPVIPRGAGSGMTGGATPLEDGLVMSMSRFNKILEIDESNLLARTEPGVIVADFQHTVEQKGLFYPPDPASSAICTIGGNVAECAGGPKAVKYGVTRDYVLGLSAVLPSGDIIKTGVSTGKGVAGYDLTRLIVGSEGTLAVVTQVTLRLLPKPSHVATMAILFSSIREATTMVSTIRRAQTPRCIEYLDRHCLELIREHLIFDLNDKIKAMLILEVDGDEHDVKKQADSIQNICMAGGALDVLMAEDNEQAQKLWAARKNLSPVMYKIASDKLNEDIVVPIDKIPDMMQFVEQLKRKYHLEIVAFGHAGDGNIHCNVLYHKDRREESERAHQAVHDLFAQTLKLGGTITGEHGIGVTKKLFLPMEVGDTQIQLMKGIKRLFDPNLILNPGKIF